MAMLVGEVKEWLGSLNDDEEIAISDGGLALVVKGERSYLDIGGIPYVDNEGCELEPGWESSYNV